MSNEQQTKIELPKGWRKLNYFSLHISYVFAALFAPMQVPAIKAILVKAFSEENYDIMNGWVLILLLISSSGAGILGYIRRQSLKKIIELLESNNVKNESDDKGRN